MAKRSATAGWPRWNAVSKHATCGTPGNRSPSARSTATAGGLCSGASGFERLDPRQRRRIHHAPARSGPGRHARRDGRTPPARCGQRPVGQRRQGLQRRGMVGSVERRRRAPACRPPWSIRRRPCRRCPPPRRSCDLAQPALDAIDAEFQAGRAGIQHAQATICSLASCPLGLSSRSAGMLRSHHDRASERQHHDDDQVRPRPTGPPRGGPAPAAWQRAATPTTSCCPACCTASCCAARTPRRGSRGSTPRRQHRCPGLQAIYTAADLKADGIGPLPCAAPVRQPRRLARRRRRRIRCWRTAWCAMSAIRWRSSSPTRPRRRATRPRRSRSITTSCPRSPTWRRRSTRARRWSGRTCRTTSCSTGRSATRRRPRRSSPRPRMSRG